MDCQTQAALEALAHPDRPVIESRLREAPPRLGHLPAVAPPPDAKVVYGGFYADHLETANFTLNWEPGVATLDQAERAGAALEAAWTYFVDEHGWTPPVSSDRFYLWVLLVDDLDATGFTTEYTTEIFPQGYPVIYLNVNWAYDAPFWASLAEHEFHHALQYAVREYDGTGGGAETWYWEASATWAAALVEPDSAALDYIVPWYGDRPDVRYDDTVGSHQYGMYVFNAWLDDPLGEGPGTMQAVWATGAAEQDATWDQILTDTTGRPAGELVGGFAAAFGNDAYSRGTTWEDPTQALLTEGLVGDADYLGTRYYTAGARAVVTLEIADDGGHALLTAPSDPTGSAGEVLVEPGERVAVTATTPEGARWSLHVRPPEEGDTGDTDTGDSGDPDTASPDGDDSPEDTGAIESPAACGCGSTGGAALSAFTLGVATIVALRRRNGRGRVSPARHGIPAGQAP